MVAEREKAEEMFERQAAEQRQYLLSVSEGLTAAGLDWILPEDFKTRFKYIGEGLPLPVYQDLGAILTKEGRVLRVNLRGETFDLEDTISVGRVDTFYHIAIRAAGVESDKKLAELTGDLASSGIKH